MIQKTIKKLKENREVTDKEIKNGKLIDKKKQKKKEIKIKKDMINK